MPIPKFAFDLVGEISRAHHQAADTLRLAIAGPLTGGKVDFLQGRAAWAWMVRPSAGASPSPTSRTAQIPSRAASTDGRTPAFAFFVNTRFIMPLICDSLCLGVIDRKRNPITGKVGVAAPDSSLQSKTQYHGCRGKIAWNGRKRLIVSGIGGFARERFKRSFKDKPPLDGHAQASRCSPEKLEGPCPFGTQ